MLFKSKKHLVGLDIGSRTIKACELVQVQQGYSLKNLAVMDIEPGIIVDGMISRPSELAGAIRALFNDHKIKEKSIALAIGGYSVIMKNISVKKTDEKAMHNSVTMEAEQYIPFDINDVNIDFHVSGKISIMLINSISFWSRQKKRSLKIMPAWWKQQGFPPVLLILMRWRCRIAMNLIMAVKIRHLPLLILGQVKPL